MFRGSLITIIAMHNKTMVRREPPIKPIYKETWWADQVELANQKNERILCYTGRSKFEYSNVGTIGHCDWGSGFPY